MTPTTGSLPLVQRLPYIEARCRGQRVLHLGCTNWPYMEPMLSDGTLLHLRLGAEARTLWGLDADQEGLDALAARGVPNLVRGDLERLDAVDIPETFDVIIAGEIIEHLSNPGLFLRGIQRFMSADTRLVLTTINAYGAARIGRYFLAGRGGRQEPVHPDHVAYYSYSTLGRLLDRHGLDVASVSFYDIGLEHRPYAPWHFKWMNDLSVWLWPQAADGLIVECTRRPPAAAPAAASTSA